MAQFHNIQSQPSIPFPNPMTAKLCETCSESFRRTEHLLRHKLTHSKQKPFGCLVCPKSFARRDAMQRHGKIHLRNIDVDVGGLDLLLLAAQTL